MTEMQQYLGVLKQLKDFDENLSREIAAKANQEQDKTWGTDAAILIDLIIILLFNGKWRIGKREMGRGKEKGK